MNIRMMKHRKASGAGRHSKNIPFWKEKCCSGGGGGGGRGHPVPPRPVPRGEGRLGEGQSPYPGAIGGRAGGGWQSWGQAGHFFLMTTLPPAGKPRAQPPAQGGTAPQQPGQTSGLQAAPATQLCAGCPSHRPRRGASFLLLPANLSPSHGLLELGPGGGAARLTLQLLQVAALGRGAGPWRLSSTPWACLLWPLAAFPTCARCGLPPRASWSSTSWRSPGYPGHRVSSGHQQFLCFPQFLIRLWSLAEFQSLSSGSRSVSLDLTLLICEMGALKERLPISPQKSCPHAASMSTDQGNGLIKGPFCTLGACFQLGFLLTKIGIT